MVTRPPILFLFPAEVGPGLGRLVGVVRYQDLGYDVEKQAGCVDALIQGLGHSLSPAAGVSIHSLLFTHILSKLYGIYNT